MHNTFFCVHLQEQTNKDIMNFETINPPRQDGFPKVKDLSMGKQVDKIDINDPNFDKPISAMEKDFKRKQNLILNFKIRR